MVCTDLKRLPQFGQEFMTKVYKVGLMNDQTQKISFLSKIPGNLGDMVMNDIKTQQKTLNQIYWIDLLFRCKEKVKYLCWQKTVHDLNPSIFVCKEVLPWTKFKGKRRTHRRPKRYGKYKVKRIANPR